VTFPPPKVAPWRSQALKLRPGRCIVKYVNHQDDGGVDVPHLLFADDLTIDTVVVLFDFRVVLRIFLEARITLFSTIISVV
jgi:hypothetical protein